METKYYKHTIIPVIYRVKDGLYEYIVTEVHMNYTVGKWIRPTDNSWDRLMIIYSLKVGEISEDEAFLEII